MTVTEVPRQHPRTRGLETKEGRPRAIKPVIDRLHDLMEHKAADIRERLDKQHATDKTVGIAIIHLTDEEAPPIKVGERVYHFHAGSFKDGAVTPHYHARIGELPGQPEFEGPDDEPYIALTPFEMNTALVENGVIGDWETDHLDEGETFVVDPYMVHSGRNGQIIFACPHDHLENYDPEDARRGNRVMTAILEGKFLIPLMANGVPDHYPREEI